MATPTICQCEVIHDFVSAIFTQACGDPPTTIYQSNSAPSGTLRVLALETTCTVTVFVQQANGNFITRSVTPTSATERAPIILTVSQIERITVACSGGTGVFAGCNVGWEMNFHYCKCCHP